MADEDAKSNDRSVSTLVEAGKTKVKIAKSKKRSNRNKIDYRVMVRCFIKFLRRVLKVCQENRIRHPDVASNVIPALLDVILHCKWNKVSPIYIDQVITLLGHLSFVSEKETQWVVTDLIAVVKSPWRKPLITSMLHGVQDLKIEEVFDLLAKEGLLVVNRVRSLLENKLPKLGLNYLTWVYRCFTWDKRPIQNTISSPNKQFIFDMYIILLNDLKSIRDVFNVLKSFSYDEIMQMVDRLRNNHRRTDIALQVANMLILKMSINVLEPDEYKLYSGLVQIFCEMCIKRTTHNTIADLKKQLNSVCKLTSTSDHIYAIAQELFKQFPTNREVVTFVIELYIRGLTTDANALDKAKCVLKEPETVRELGNKLSRVFQDVASVFPEYELRREFVLNAFCVNPCTETFKVLENVANDCPAEKPTSTLPDDCSWHNLSKSGTHLCFTCGGLFSHDDDDWVEETPVYEEPDPTKLLDPQKTSFAPHLCDDLNVVLSSTRIQQLHWNLERSEMFKRCRNYIEQYKDLKLMLSKELEYLNIDYNQFKHIPGINYADDPYAGVEKGYEHFIEFSEEEVEVEDDFEEEIRSDSSRNRGGRSRKSLDSQDSRSRKFDSDNSEEYKPPSSNVGRSRKPIDPNASKSKLSRPKKIIDVNQPNRVIKDKDKLKIKIKINPLLKSVKSDLIDLTKSDSNSSEDRSRLNLPKLPHLPPSIPFSNSSVQHHLPPFVAQSGLVPPVTSHSGHYPVPSIAQPLSVTSDIKPLTSSTHIQSETTALNLPATSGSQHLPGSPSTTVSVVTPSTTVSSNPNTVKSLRAFRPTIRKQEKSLYSAPLLSSTHPPKKLFSTPLLSSLQSPKPTFSSWSQNDEIGILSSPPSTYTNPSTSGRSVINVPLNRPIGNFNPGTIAMRNFLAQKYGNVQPNIPSEHSQQMPSTSTTPGSAVHNLSSTSTILGATGHNLISTSTSSLGPIAHNLSSTSTIEPTVGPSTHNFSSTTLESTSLNLSSSLATGHNLTSTPTTVGSVGYNLSSTSTVGSTRNNLSSTTKYGSTGCKLSSTSTPTTLGSTTHNLSSIPTHGSTSNNLNSTATTLGSTAHNLSSISTPTTLGSTVHNFSATSTTLGTTGYNLTTPTTFQSTAYNLSSTYSVASTNVGPSDYNLSSTYPVASTTVGSSDYNISSTHQVASTSSSTKSVVDILRMYNATSSSTVTSSGLSTSPMQSDNLETSNSNKPFHERKILHDILSKPVTKRKIDSDPNNQTVRKKRPYTRRKPKDLTTNKVKSITKSTLQSVISDISFAQSTNTNQPNQINSQQTVQIENQNQTNANISKNNLTIFQSTAKFENQNKIKTNVESNQHLLIPTTLFPSTGQMEETNQTKINEPKNQQRVLQTTNKVDSLDKMKTHESINADLNQHLLISKVKPSTGQMDNQNQPRVLQTTNEVDSLHQMKTNESINADSNQHLLISKVTPSTTSQVDNQYQPKINEPINQPRVLQTTKKVDSLHQMKTNESINADSNQHLLLSKVKPSTSQMDNQNQTKNNESINQPKLLQTTNKVDSLHQMKTHESINDDSNQRLLISKVKPSTGQMDSQNQTKNIELINQPKVLQTTDNVDTLHQIKTNESINADSKQHLLLSKVTPSTTSQMDSKNQTKNNESINQPKVLQTTDKVDSLHQMKTNESINADSDQHLLISKVKPSIDQMDSQNQTKNIEPINQPRVLQTTDKVYSLHQMKTHELINADSNQHVLISKVKPSTGQMDNKNQPKIIEPINQPIVLQTTNKVDSFHQIKRNESINADSHQDLLISKVTPSTTSQMDSKNQTKNNDSINKPKVLQTTDKVDSLHQMKTNESIKADSNQHLLISKVMPSTGRMDNQNQTKIIEPINHPRVLETTNKVDSFHQIKRNESINADSHQDLLISKVTPSTTSQMDSKNQTKNNDSINKPKVLQTTDKVDSLHQIKTNESINADSNQHLLISKVKPSTGQINNQNQPKIIEPINHPRVLETTNKVDSFHQIKRNESINADSHQDLLISKVTPSTTSQMDSKNQTKNNDSINKSKVLQTTDKVDSLHQIKTNESINADSNQHLMLSKVTPSTTGQMDSQNQTKNYESINQPKVLQTTDKVDSLHRTKRNESINAGSNQDSMISKLMPSTTGHMDNQNQPKINEPINQPRVFQTTKKVDSLRQMKTTESINADSNQHLLISKVKSSTGQMDNQNQPKNIEPINQPRVLQTTNKDGSLHQMKTNESVNADSNQDLLISKLMPSTSQMDSQNQTKNIEPINPPKVLQTTDKVDSLHQMKINESINADSNQHLSISKVKPATGQMDNQNQPKIYEPINQPRVLQTTNKVDSIHQMETNKSINADSNQHLLISEVTPSTTGQMDNQNQPKINEPINQPKVPQTTNKVVSLHQMKTNESINADSNQHLLISKVKPSTGQMGNQNQPKVLQTTNKVDSPHQIKTNEPINADSNQHLLISNLMPSTGEMDSQNQTFNESTIQNTVFQTADSQTKMKGYESTKSISNPYLLLIPPVLPPIDQANQDQTTAITTCTNSVKSMILEAIKKHQEKSSQNTQNCKTITATTIPAKVSTSTNILSTMIPVTNSIPLDKVGSLHQMKTNESINADSNQHLSKSKLMPSTGQMDNQNRITVNESTIQHTVFQTADCQNKMKINESSVLPSIDQIVNQTSVQPFSLPSIDQIQNKMDVSATCVDDSKMFDDSDEFDGLDNLQIEKTISEIEANIKELENFNLEQSKTVTVDTTSSLSVSESVDTNTKNTGQQMKQVIEILEQQSDLIATALSNDCERNVPKITTNTSNVITKSSESKETEIGITVTPDTKQSDTIYETKYHHKQISSNSIISQIDFSDLLKSTDSAETKQKTHSEFDNLFKNLYEDQHSKSTDQPILHSDNYSDQVKLSPKHHFYKFCYQKTVEIKSSSSNEVPQVDPSKTSNVMESKLTTSESSTLTSISPSKFLSIPEKPADNETTAKPSTLTRDSFTKCLSDPKKSADSKTVTKCPSTIACVSPSKFLSTPEKPADNETTAQTSTITRDSSTKCLSDPKKSAYSKTVTKWPSTIASVSSSKFLSTPEKPADNETTAQTSTITRDSSTKCLSDPKKSAYSKTVTKWPSTIASVSSSKFLSTPEKPADNEMTAQPSTITRDSSTKCLSDPKKSADSKTVTKCPSTIASVSPSKFLSIPEKSADNETTAQPSTITRDSATKCLSDPKKSADSKTVTKGPSSIARVSPSKFLSTPHKLADNETTVQTSTLTRDSSTKCLSDPEKSADSDTETKCPSTITRVSTTKCLTTPEKLTDNKTATTCSSTLTRVSPIKYIPNSRTQTAWPSPLKDDRAYFFGNILSEIEKIPAKKSLFSEEIPIRPVKVITGLEYIKEEDQDPSTLRTVSPTSPEVILNYDERKFFCKGPSESVVIPPPPETISTFTEALKSLSEEIYSKSSDDPSPKFVSPRKVTKNDETQETSVKKFPKAKPFFSIYTNLPCNPTACFFLPLPFNNEEGSKPPKIPKKCDCIINKPVPGIVTHAVITKSSPTPKIRENELTTKLLIAYSNIADDSKVQLEDLFRIEVEKNELQQQTKSTVSTSKPLEIQTEILNTIESSKTQQLNKLVTVDSVAPTKSILTLKTASSKVQEPNKFITALKVSVSQTSTTNQTSSTVVKPKTCLESKSTISVPNPSGLTLTSMGKSLRLIKEGDEYRLVSIPFTTSATTSVSTNKTVTSSTNTLQTMITQAIKKHQEANSIQNIQNRETITPTTTIPAKVSTSTDTLSPTIPVTTSILFKSTTDSKLKCVPKTSITENCTSSMPTKTSSVTTATSQIKLGSALGTKKSTQTVLATKMLSTPTSVIKTGTSVSVNNRPMTVKSILLAPANILTPTGTQGTKLGNITVLTATASTSTVKPVSSTNPTVTTKHVATTIPTATVKPPVTAKPTVKTPVTAKSTTTVKPPVTAKSTATDKPPVTANSTATVKPPVTAKPTVKTPVTAKSTTTVKPPVTAKSTATIKPPVTAKPRDTVKSPVTAKSVVTVKHPVTAKSAATVKPPVTTKPLVTAIQMKPIALTDNWKSSTSASPTIMKQVETKAPLMLKTKTKLLTTFTNSLKLARESETIKQVPKPTPSLSTKMIHLPPRKSTPDPITNISQPNDDIEILVKPKVSSSRPGAPPTTFTNILKNQKLMVHQPKNNLNSHSPSSPRSIEYENHEGVKQTTFLVQRKSSQKFGIRVLSDEKFQSKCSFDSQSSSSTESDFTVVRASNGDLELKPSTKSNFQVAKTYASNKQNDDVKIPDLVPFATSSKRTVVLGKHKLMSDNQTPSQSGTKRPKNNAAGEGSSSFKDSETVERHQNLQESTGGAVPKSNNIPSTNNVSVQQTTTVPTLSTIISSPNIVQNSLNTANGSTVSVVRSTSAIISNSTTLSSHQSNTDTPTLVNMLIHRPTIRSTTTNHQELTGTGIITGTAPSSMRLKHLYQTTVEDVSTTAVMTTSVMTSSTPVTVPVSNIIRATGMTGIGGAQTPSTIQVRGATSTSGTPHLLSFVNSSQLLKSISSSDGVKPLQLLYKISDGKTYITPVSLSTSSSVKTHLATVNKQQTGEIVKVEVISPTSKLTPTTTAVGGASTARSVFEETYAKFIHIGRTSQTQTVVNSSSGESTVTSNTATASTLPKFQQAFGKTTNFSNSQTTRNTDQQPLLLVSKMSGASVVSASSASPSVTSTITSTITSTPITVLPVSIGTSVVATSTIQRANTNNQVRLITRTTTSASTSTSNNNKLIENKNDERCDVDSNASNDSLPSSGGAGANNNSTTVCNQQTVSIQPSGQQSQTVLTPMRLALPIVQRTAGGGIPTTRVMTPVLLRQRVLLTSGTVGTPIRLPQNARVLTSNMNTLEPAVSSSTLEQLREFDKVFEKVKERSTTVQPVTSVTATTVTATVPSTTVPSTVVSSPQVVTNFISKLDNSNTADTSDDSTQTSNRSSTPIMATFQTAPHIDTSNLVVGSQQQRVSVAYVSGQLGQTILSSPVVVMQQQPMSMASSTPSPALSVTSQSSSSSPSSSSNANNNPISSSKSNQTTPIKLNPTIATASKTIKNKPIKPNTQASPLKASPVPKPQQKPQEDEGTAQRIYSILAEYAEQLRNSPDLNNKPAPRRRSNPPANPSQNSKRKKSSGGKKVSTSGGTGSGSGMEMSPGTVDDHRTIGSEDSSCGVQLHLSHLSQDSPSQAMLSMDDAQSTEGSMDIPGMRGLHGMDNSNDCMDRPSSSQSASAVSVSATSVVSVPTSVASAHQTPQHRQLILTDQITSNSTGNRNVIITDSVVSEALAQVGKITNTATVLVPGNYLLPMSMVKGGHQITIVSGGSKILAVKPLKLPTNTTLSNNPAGTSQQITTQVLVPTSNANAQKISTQILNRTVVSSSETNLIRTTQQTTGILSGADGVITSRDHCNSLDFNSSGAVLTVQSSNTKSHSTLVETNNTSHRNTTHQLQLQVNDPTTISGSNGPLLSQLCNELNDTGNHSSGIILTDASSTNVINVGPIHNGKVERDCIDSTKNSFKKNWSNNSDTIDQHHQSGASPIFRHSPGMQYATSTIDSTQPDKKARTININNNNNNQKQLSIQAQRKQAAIERELRLQKSLSEECEDLGVDEPSASDLFPEAEILFDNTNQSPSFGANVLLQDVVTTTCSNDDENIFTSTLDNGSSRDLTTTSSQDIKNKLNDHIDYLLVQKNKINKNGTTKFHTNVVAQCSNSSQSSYEDTNTLITNTPLISDVTIPSPLPQSTSYCLPSPYRAESPLTQATHSHLYTYSKKSNTKLAAKKGRSYSLFESDCELSSSSHDDTNSRTSSTSADQKDNDSLSDSASEAQSDNNTRKYSRKRPYKLYVYDENGVDASSFTCDKDESHDPGAHLNNTPSSDNNDESMSAMSADMMEGMMDDSSESSPHSILSDSDLASISSGLRRSSKRGHVRKGCPCCTTATDTSSPPTKRKFGKKAFTQHGHHHAATKKIGGKKIS